MTQFLQMPAAFQHLPLAKLQAGAEFIEDSMSINSSAKVARDLGKLAYAAGEPRPDPLHCTTCARGAMGWKQEEYDFVTAVAALLTAKRNGR